MATATITSATTSPTIPQDQSTSNYATKSKLKSIKEVAESPHHLTCIPSNYAYFSDPSAKDHHDISYDQYTIPVIDFSLLQSHSSHQRSRVIQDLGDACQHWGFFMVVNHGVPETLMKSMMDTCQGFFNLTAEEKREFEGKNVLDPIRCGTSFNTSVEQVHFWRDYLKVMTHPEFHSPSKPHGFSETLSEYCKHIREVARVVLRGIWASLGLDELEIERSIDLEMGQQILVANYYPPCPQPDLAIGMPPHSDHGLLTFLTHNQVDGLQIHHNGKWVPVHALPDSFLVNTADHIEILSNGKYKSVLHRAVVNNRETRISVAVANGPSLDAIVAPASQLIQDNNSSNKEEASGSGGGGGARYKSMSYREYLQLQQSARLSGKSGLDILKV